MRPDQVGSITDLSVFDDGSYDAVFSSHNIEHLFAHEVPIALGEFARVLNPKTGIAIITCPDIQALGQRIAEGRVLEPLYQSPAGPITPIDILYGHRASIARGNHHMAHKVGLTAQVLLGAMKQSGFPQAIGFRQIGAFALWAIGFMWDANPQEKRQHQRAFFPT